MAPYHKIMIKVKMTAPLKWRAFLLNVLQFLSLTLTVDTLLHEESKGDNIGAMPKLLDFVKYENSTLLEPNMYANIKNFQDQNIFDVDYDSLGESLHAGRREQANSQFRLQRVLNFSFHMYTAQTYYHYQTVAIFVTYYQSQTQLVTLF